MPERRKTVDPKSYELALHFLQDETNVTEDEPWALASDIQTAVEDYINFRKRKENEWMTEAQIDHMVHRFLMWNFPENFHPDGGISFKRAAYEGTPYLMPSGTNLLDVQQTEAMVRHMIEGLP